MAKKKPLSDAPQAKVNPFRRAVLRGLGVVLPPLLTIVIFVWVGNTVADYLLEPLENGARRIAIYFKADIVDAKDAGNLPRVDNHYLIDSTRYTMTGDGKLVPSTVYENVASHLGNDVMPVTAKGVYEKWVDNNYLQRHVVIPVFLLFFILTLYLLGKFLAAGVGKFFWHRFELVIHSLPLVRNVYSSVKQVTDFMFSEREIEYTRVVAVEYPRKGVWTLAMVTGDSMLDIRCAANEPVVSVLIPTSPMPFTGFTVTVKKSETIDLNITIDQAFQFIVSCGVVVPPQQVVDAIETSGSRRFDPPAAILPHDTSVAPPPDAPPGTGPPPESPPETDPPG